MSMRQGEIRWCEFPPPDRGRPVVILTRDGLIPSLSSVTVAPITTTLQDLNSRVRLNAADGLREPSDVNLHGIQSVRKERVGRWIATLRPERMREINAAIRYSLGFDRYEED